MVIGVPLKILYNLTPKLFIDNIKLYSRDFCTMKLIIFLIFALSGFLWATEEDPYTMGGYKLSDFKNFEKTWNVVTVRYRKDSGEMRFVYANPQAWKALLEGAGSYPDGAVFGKISLGTKKDLSFPSSLVPSGGRRIQFMVKNKAKHKSTGGWGYALFSMDGKRHPGDVNKKQRACYACHTLTRDRDFVFSTPMQLVSLQPNQLSQGNEWRTKISFKTGKYNDLPKELKKVLKPQKVRFITGILTENIFYGTLDEIRPILIEEYKRTKMASALFSKDGSQFSVIFENLEKTCPKKDQKSLKAIHTVPNKEKPLYEIEFCE